MKGTFEVFFELSATVVFVVLLVALYNAATHDQPQEKVECEPPTKGTVEVQPSFSFRDAVSGEVTREYRF